MNKHLAFGRVLSVGNNCTSIYYLSEIEQQQKQQKKEKTLNALIEKIEDKLHNNIRELATTEKWINY